MKNFYEIMENLDGNMEYIYELTSEEVDMCIEEIEKLMNHNHNYKYNTILECLNYMKEEEK